MQEKKTKPEELGVNHQANASNLLLDCVNLDCHNMTLEVILNMIASLLLIIPAQVDMSFA